VRCDQRSEPVERLLGAHLLQDADAGVGDENAEEERVLPLAEGQRQAPGDRQDEVEDGEDVRPDDALVRASARLLRGWTTLGAPFRGLR
jgi:hypothetical protein